MKIQVEYKPTSRFDASIRIEAELNYDKVMGKYSVRSILEDHSLSEYKWRVVFGEGETTGDAIDQFIESLNDTKGD